MNRIIAAALFACLVQSPVAYGAEAFPDRPIKLVVPSPPGGPPDIMARLLTDEMGAALGEPVVVENRVGGAGGLMGARAVLGAEPDGYTILMGSTSTLLTAPLIYKDAGYNTASFAPIANLSETVEVLAVNPSCRRTQLASWSAWRRHSPACCISARREPARCRISKANC